MEDAGYKVHTEEFDGPLDLLLHLIRKNRMDIRDIRLAEITSEYLAYLEENRGLNPSQEGEFLMTASILIYIKSRSLLPRPESLSDESAEEKLVHTLIEYDKVQKISHLLKDMEKNERLLMRREDVPENFEEKEFDLEEVSSFQLAELFINMVHKKNRKPKVTIDSKKYSIEDKQIEILQMLEENDCLDFSDYMSNLEDLEDILVSFFTLLELVKQKIIVAVQKKRFGTISVWNRDRGQNHE